MSGRKVMTHQPFVPRIWMAVVGILAVGALLIIGVLRDAPAQEAVDNSRNAATKPVEKAPPRKMTPDMAAVFVQHEYPGEFTNSARLLQLFKANCEMLNAGASYDMTVQGLIDTNVITAPQAIYILNMSIYSTCPDRL